ncbi:MAG TPA: amidohydrolase family protein [Armatimonadota bacterium]|jgi:hypothetical protein
MSRNTPLVQAFRAHGRLASCPVIDMHTHADAYHAIYFPHPEPEGIIRSMDRCGIRLIVTTPHAALADAAYGNQVLLRLLADHPQRILGYWYINPHYPALLEASLPRPLATPGVFGFKIHPSGADYPIDGEGYRALFAWADAQQLPVLAHTWQGELCGVAACRRVAERYPAMRFILGHSCWPDWDGAIALAREFPHVYLELTAAERMPGFVEQVVRAGQAEKLLFGTDLPWFDPNFGLGCVLSSDIDDDHRHAILHRNAERLLAERGMLPASDEAAPTGEPGARHGRHAIL